MTGKFLPNYVEAVFASRRLPPKAAVSACSRHSFVQKQGSNLVMNLGFSHQVNVPDTEDCTIVWQDPNHFSVTGIDKQKVGQYAAEIRAKKPPEPYKGKGIRYAGEVVKHKEGKAGKGKK